jgi:hypothetical protein
MSELTDDRLREIIAGCDGVTPGPWEMIDLGGNANAMVCDTKDTILSVHRRTRPKAFETAIAAHIARLDPQTVTAICEELLARRSPPSGYRLVPVEPTREMILAAEAELENQTDSDYDSDADGNRYPYSIRRPGWETHVYAAMLAAAPTPKSTEGK